MWKRDGMFAMTSDHGLTYYVYREVEVTSRVDYDGPVTTPGEARLVTSFGSLVDRVRQGEYVVRGSGLRLWCNDPNAS